MQENGPKLDWSLQALRRGNQHAQAELPQAADARSAIRHFQGDAAACAAQIKASHFLSRILIGFNKMIGHRRITEFPSQQPGARACLMLSNLHMLKVPRIRLASCAGDGTSVDVLSPLLLLRRSRQGRGCSLRLDASAAARAARSPSHFSWPPWSWRSFSFRA